MGHATGEVVAGVALTVVPASKVGVAAEALQRLTRPRAFFRRSRSWWPSYDDTLGAGHVLSHVRLTDAELAARAVPNASTFIDRAAAESALADVQEANSAAIQGWLTTAKPRARQAFAATFDRPVAAF